MVTSHGQCPNVCENPLPGFVRARESPHKSAFELIHLSNPNAIATSRVSSTLRTQITDANLKQVKVNHALVGWQNAFRVLTEVKGPTLCRLFGSLALSLCRWCHFCLCQLTWQQWYHGKEIQNSGQLIAAVFFRRIFGPWFGVKIFTIPGGSQLFWKYFMFLSYHQNITDFHRCRRHAGCRSRYKLFIYLSL